MKKIAAFLTALVLFIIIVIVIHFTIFDTVSVKSKGFGTWVNNYKDLSNNAIKENIGKDTVMLMGSSEFQRAKKSDSHPTNLFRSTDTDVMIVGAAYNQSLSHAITLGAVAPELKSKKAVLILSPSWFEKTGVRKEAYSVRFSESAYLNFMNNPDISDDVKNQVADRTVELLSTNPTMQRNVKSYNRSVLGKHKLNLADNVYFALRKQFLKEREYVSLDTVWKAKGEPDYKKFKKQMTEVTPDFDFMRQENQVRFDENPYHIRQSIYKKKFKPVEAKQKDVFIKRTFPESSPEYKDLELFLKVAKEENIKVKLILLPVNGYWYDYTGFTKDRRDVLPSQIKNITDKYDVDFTSFYGNDYNDGWLQDAFHPSKEGWVDISEQIYDFCHKDFQKNKKSSN